MDDNTHGGLYHWNTWAATARLEALRVGPENVDPEKDTVEPTDQEIIFLWKTFKEGSYEATGDTQGASLVEFGQWISASGPYANEKPAEVTW